jgi:hypothetical protein
MIECANLHENFEISMIFHSIFLLCSGIASQPNDRHLFFVRRHAK